MEATDKFKLVFKSMINEKAFPLITAFLRKFGKQKWNIKYLRRNCKIIMMFVLFFPLAGITLGVLFFTASPLALPSGAIHCSSSLFM